jgi:hypothetical protein
MLVPLLGTRAGEDRRIQLDQGGLRLTLGVGRGPYIHSIWSEPQRRFLMQPRQPLPLYQLVLVDGGRTGEVHALQADAVAVEAATPELIRVRTVHKQARVNVVAELFADKTADTLSFRLLFEQEDPHVRIGLARYPGIAVPLNVPDLAVLVPVADGNLLTDPASHLQEGAEQGYAYPGLASAQLLAAYDAVGGLLAYAADGNGYSKRLSLRRHDGALLLLFDHILLHEEASGAFSLPYPVRLAGFDGDWQRAATLYKRWAVRQAWCRTALEGRELPRAIAKPSIYLGINVREVDGHNAIVDRLPQIPDLVHSWATGLGCPVTALLLGWEKHGAWITPDYFPPFGGDRFQEMLSELGDANSAMVFVSGLRYTLNKTARPGSEPYKAKGIDLKALEAMAVAGQDGKPMHIGTADRDQGEHLWLCPALPAAWRQLHDTAARLATIGMDQIQIDQIPGGGSPLCFSQAHGHPRAGGDWMYRRTFEELSAIRKEIRSIRPGSVLSLECPGELFIPCVDLFHTREYIHGVWPRERSGVRAVPLFSFLYHEYALGYGGDSAPFVTNSNELSVAIYCQAMNLACGRYPGAAVWLKSTPFAGLDPEFRRFVQETTQLWQSPAGRYLQLGRALPIRDPKPMEIAHSLQLPSGTFRLVTPGVLVSAHAAGDGTAGLLYVNLTDRPMNFTATFPEDFRAGSYVWPADRGLVRDGDRIEIEPYRFVFIQLGRAKPMPPPRLKALSGQ